jgi:hypothetical protein
METTPTFATEEDAFTWMYEELQDEDCRDNERFAFLDDPAAVAAFDDASSHGCCGSAEFEIIVGGRKAIIGCNFGH